MKRCINTALYFTALFLFSCTNRDDPSIEGSFISKGKYDDKGYEIGWWKFFYNPDNHLMEEGNFVNGVRIGKWNYYAQFRDSIIWNPYTDVSGDIRTNIPEFLTLIEETENLIKFRNSDSNHLFNLVIGKEYTTDTTSLELYKKMIYDDLSNRAVKISDSTTNYIETSHGNKYLFSFVSGVTEQTQENFLLFNIAGKINGRLIEVSLRCERQYDNKARKVFFSVIPNLFVDSLRFISSKDIITTLEDSIK